MFISQDFIQFRKLFVTQLKNMLSEDELGTFILVMANSRQDEFLRTELDKELKNTFIALKHKFRTQKFNAAADDMAVFEQLINLNLHDIPVWQYKNMAGWELAYNPMRQLRPARSSSQILNSINQDFDATKFHFNKAFLKPEILWEETFKDTKVRVLYNKFPFSNYHLIIVLSPQENRCQLLTQETHQYVFSLVEEMREVLPGFGAGFNSLAAGASVNHFHFQGFVREQGFPIENKCWQHNQGDVDYPLTVERFSDVKISWEYIEQLIEQDVAFNCLYKNNSCYVIPRKYQGTVELPEWLTGAGWIDVAGAITVSDKDTFNSIDGQSISRALGLLK